MYNPKKNRTFAALLQAPLICMCAQAELRYKKDMTNEVVKYEEVKDRIITLRGEPVLLDADVAQLYGVETRVVNQAVKNNPDKFPEGFLIPLTPEEKQEVIKNFDHLQGLKFSPVNPTAFTESGLYMLATILKKWS